MKSICYEIRGCSGSFREVEVSRHETIKAARDEAKRRNQLNADRRGESLRDYLNDRSNYEGSYGASRTKSS